MTFIDRYRSIYLFLFPSCYTKDYLFMFVNLTLNSESESTEKYWNIFLMVYVWILILRQMLFKMLIILNKKKLNKVKKEKKNKQQNPTDNRTE